MESTTLQVWHCPLCEHVMHARSKVAVLEAAHDHLVFVHPKADPK